MPIAFVTGQKGFSFFASSTSNAVVLPAPPTANNILVVTFGTPTNPGTVGLSGFTQVTSTQGGGTHSSMWWRVAQSGDSATHTVTNTVSANTSVHIMEYSGVATTNPLDQFQSSNSGTTLVTFKSTGTTPANNTTANSLVIATVSGSGSLPDGVGEAAWTGAVTSERLTNDQTARMSTGDAFPTAIGTFEATYTWSAATDRRAAAIIAVFKEASAATYVPRMALLGVG